MPFKSLMLSLTLILSLTANANVTGQAVKQLGELIATKAGAEKLIERKAIFAAGSESMESVSNDFQLVFKAFGISGKRVHEKLATSLSKLKGVTDEDKKRITDIQELLKKSEISEDDIIKAHDELLYLASRYGKKGNVMLVCLSCSADSAITAKGIKYGLLELTDSRSKKLIRQIRSMGPEGVSKYISEQMSLNKYGDYSKVSGSALSADEEIAFALFLMMKKNGGRNQKAYVAAVEKVLGKSQDNYVDFFNANKKHSLHMFFQENHDPAFLKNYTKFASDIADTASAEGLSSKEAYEKVLRSKALRKNAAGELVEDPALLKRVNKVLGRCPMFK